MASTIANCHLISFAGSSLTDSLRLFICTKLGWQPEWFEINLDLKFIDFDLPGNEKFILNRSRERAKQQARTKRNKNVSDREVVAVAVIIQLSANSIYTPNICPTM